MLKDDIQNAIDELYFSVSEPNKDFPDNIYFRKEKIDKAVFMRIKDAHIAISHYLRYVE